MRARLVAGNWKMHGSLAANARLLDALKAGLEQAEGLGYAVCAPFPYLAQVSQALSGSRIAWGAQNVSEHDSGAYTGEVSGAMLKEFGCRFAIVGHSERRGLYGEGDSTVAAKFVAARSERQGAGRERDDPVRRQRQAKQRPRAVRDARRRRRIDRRGLARGEGLHRDLRRGAEITLENAIWISGSR